MAHYEMKFTLQWTINSGCAVIFPDSSSTSTWKGKAVPFSIFRISESGFTFNWRGGPVKNAQLQNNSYILDNLWDTKFKFLLSQRFYHQATKIFVVTNHFKQFRYICWFVLESSRLSVPQHIPSANLLNLVENP